MKKYLSLLLFFGQAKKSKEATNFNTSSYSFALMPKNQPAYRQEDHTSRASVLHP